MDAAPDALARVAPRNAPRGTRLQRGLRAGGLRLAVAATTGAAA